MESPATMGIINLPDEERNSWAKLSLESLDRSYGADEPEYSLDLIKEVNPDYEGR
jgi:hypothetical protein